MSDLITSIIRTVVPTIVGAVASFTATQGLELTAEQLAALSTTLTTAFGALYYVLARLIESRWPRWGVLLGSPKKPTY